MGSEVLLVDVADRVAVLTMHRPEARNALSTELRSALVAEVVRADADPDVDALIVTGTDPAFSAGVDFKELAAGMSPTIPADGEPPDYYGPFAPHRKPLIGAVNGVCITGGLEIALACDFLVASERARFADTHARVGIMPGWGLTIGLVQSVGVRRAREMSTTGNFVDAPTALAWGLVNHVVAHQELLAFCRELARAMVGVDQPSLRRLRGLYDEVLLVDGADAWAHEKRVSDDWLRGFDPAAFAGRAEAIKQRGRSQL